MLDINVIEYRDISIYKQEELKIFFDVFSNTIMHSTVDEVMKHGSVWIHTLFDVNSFGRTDRISIHLSDFVAVNDITVPYEAVVLRNNSVELFNEGGKGTFKNFNDFVDYWE
ncbi:hypothetical protein FDI40_gp564 [Agrobacterium phage Atu_ph07]|uniref:Uncharacterized protein n=1 Tax=Agrobacterium phage Atu_ph07 TaxID=2024264 RepID=A0A2L0V0L8_9CAUD|nr:hypothetical protein FDI40_gp564 [Agrobacterium phage Atu_ph07]AUZ95323.1 hypothetical protein [Agrobacterium phage Atu_ph07]